MTDQTTPETSVAPVAPVAPVADVFPFLPANSAARIARAHALLNELADISITFGDKARADYKEFIAKLKAHL